MTCPSHASFRLLTVARRGSWGSTGKFDLAPHPVVGVVLQVEDAETFPLALGFENLDPFLRVSKPGPCLRALEEDGGDNLTSLPKLIVFLRQILFHLTIAAIVEGRLLRFT